MTKVSKAIEYLSKLDPNEEIALTGWWTRSDVEENNELDLTDEQWETICVRHEKDPELDIDYIVQIVLREEKDED
jgi:hypothetical protein